VHYFRLCRGEVTFCGFKIRFRRFNLRLGREVTTLDFVDFLLSHQPWLALGHTIQPFVFEVQNIVFRFGAAQLIRRIRYLILHTSGVRFVLLQLGSEFRNFQDRHELSFSDVRAVVHEQLTDVAGLFGVDLNLLKRHKLGGNGELTFERMTLDLNDSDSDGLWLLCCRIVLGVPEAVTRREENGRRRDRSEWKQTFRSVKTAQEPV
jgi:hypothetical protein